MSRWTSWRFSFLFGTWWQRGSENAIYVLIWACIDLYRTYVSISFRTPLIFVRTMWCENICNVCYFMLSCRICLCSKEFVLVILSLTWWLFFCVLVQKGRILRIPWPESPGSYPESPGLAGRHTFYWVDNMSYASLMFLHAHVHPTVKHIRVFVVLLIYANYWHVKSKLKFKVHGIH